MKKLTLLLLLIMTGVSFSQRPAGSPREALYQALDIYSLGRYDEAHEKFKYLSELYSLEGHHTIFKYMAAKSLYKAGDFNRARDGFERFIRDYPSSGYIGVANLYLGHIAYQESRFLDGGIFYLKAIDYNYKSKTGRVAASNLAGMLASELSVDDLSYIIDNYPRSEYAGEIVYSLGKRHYENQRYKRAVKLFGKYLENYTPGNHTAEVKKLHSLARDKAFKKIVVGVLAPITGSYSDYGSAMIDGIKLAFANMPKLDGKEIELVVKDTQGSPVIATQAIKALALEEPAVVMGPLRSESAVGAAIVANFNDIPLITPTASEHGIAELGENVFQMSPPAEIIATALAEYAVTELEIKEFGIIAPGDFAGRQVARAFRQKVYQLGGEVLSNTFYEPGETDFSHQIRPLREQLLMKTEEQMALELIDSTEYYNEENEKWLDQEDWRVYLGGLFLPGYPSELSLLIPQIRYHVVSTRYLGLDGWDSSDLRDEIERYIDGSIFATDYHPGIESRAWDDFYIQYYETYGSEPGRVAALSYDAANLIKVALENGAYTAENISAFLNSIEDYQGASCTVNFKTTSHANNAVSIFEIGQESVSRLK
ncbi:MAG: ABC transporter substrate-binding protein [candidate division Zixibacteria bacterium]|nr:ABC transporter substrate-binding protein [candidate division Zixibacteria bacterium]